jgi:hypothetical protein
MTFLHYKDRIRYECMNGARDRHSVLRVGAFLSCSLLGNIGTSQFTGVLIAKRCSLCLCFALLSVDGGKVQRLLMRVTISAVHTFNGTFGAVYSLVYEWRRFRCAHGFIIIVKELCVYPVYLSTRNSYSRPKVTLMPSRQLFYIHMLPKSEVGVVIQRSEVICCCTNAEFFPRYFTRLP